MVGVGDEEKLIKTNGFEFVATIFALQLISCDNQQVAGSSVTNNAETI